MRVIITYYCNYGKLFNILEIKLILNSGKIITYIRDIEKRENV